MPFYRICPYCRAYLDLGERCDCQDKKEAAPVRQHQSGKVESELPQPHSTPMISKTGRKIKEVMT